MKRGGRVLTPERINRMREEVAKSEIDALSGKMAIPNRIRTLRYRSRLTQVELAVLIKRDVVTISLHENGARELDEKDIRDYCRVFKCPTHHLFIRPREGENTDWKVDE